MEKKHSVNYYKSLSRLTSLIHPLIFLQNLQGFIFLHNSVFECSLKGCISHYVWDNFTNLRCSDYWKIPFQVKKIKVGIFNHAPPAKLSPRMLSLPPSPSRGKLLIFPRQYLFPKIYPSSRKGDGGGNYVQIWIFLRIFFGF